MTIGRRVGLSYSSDVLASGHEMQSPGHCSLLTYRTGIIPGGVPVRVKIDKWSRCITRVGPFPQALKAVAGSP